MSLTMALISSLSKARGLFKLVEDADEIEDETVGFHHLPRFILVRAVHPGNGLEQGVVAHRLIEVHGVEQRRVKAGQ